MPSDIVVTGWGIWSAAGVTPDEAARRALAGEPTAVWHEVGLVTIAACAAPEPPPDALFPQIRRMDLSARFALAAARAALQSACLDPSKDVDPTRFAILVGNSRGPVEKYHEPDPGRMRPSKAANTTVAALSGALSIALGAQGPCMTISATCASSAHAIALGAGFLAGDTADVVLAGGSEAPIVPELAYQFLAAGILGHGSHRRESCRPFDRDRNGTVMGEGAAFLVLERERRARARSAPILARLAGCAIGSEARNRVATHPEGKGLARVMTQALGVAGLDPAAIGHVNCHGTGTVVNDAAEAAAIRRVFGPLASRLPVSSTKAVTGHTFGAAGAIEAVLAIAALRSRVAPPSAGCFHPDRTLGLDIIQNSPRPLSSPFVMSNSLGFWGNTGCLIFGAPN